MLLEQSMKLAFHEQKLAKFLNPCSGRDEWCFVFLLEGLLRNKVNFHRWDWGLGEDVPLGRIHPLISYNGLTSSKDQKLFSRRFEIDCIAFAQRNRYLLRKAQFPGLHFLSIFCTKSSVSQIVNFGIEGTNFR